MPRPRRCRRVGFEPGITYFKPAGILKAELEETILAVDEFEAIRLKDLIGLDQEKAAKKMSISQPTFHRLVLNARKKIADAIVNAKAIRIEGGNFRMTLPKGIESGPGIGRGAGRGRCFGGPAVACKCPKCGLEKPKFAGVPCANEKCPRCGDFMMRY